LSRDECVDKLFVDMLNAVSIKLLVEANENQKAEDNHSW
jgi:hypothetical protein